MTTVAIGRYTNIQSRKQALEATRVDYANMMMSSVLKLAKSAMMASRRG